ADGDVDPAGAEEIQPLKWFALLGKSGPIGNFAELAGKQEPSNLSIVETSQNTAQQLAISLRQPKRQPILDQPIKLVSVNADEHQVPSDPGSQVAPGEGEVENLERQPDDGHQPQPENVRQPVRDRDKHIGEMTWPIVEAEERCQRLHRSILIELPVFPFPRFRSETLWV